MMIRTTKTGKSPQGQLKALGWDWMLGEDTMPYITEDAVMVSAKEVDAYYTAAEQLYEMYVEAAQYVIDKSLFSKIGIPANMVDIIRHTWEDDKHLHLYGRFDLAGGVAGTAIKLIEFNADTPTSIPETAVVQWAHLKANGYDEAGQFNNLYESLVNHFKKLKVRNPRLEATILFSTIEGSQEDDTNVSVLMEAAKEAGFEAAFSYVHEVEFSEEEGIFLEDEHGDFYKYDFWFKLIPWEFIATEEPELLDKLTQIVKKDLAVVINPAYTLLFQSKGLMRILWDLYPHHPLLLETRDNKIHFKPYVEKVMFGREGANVRILDARGNVLEEQDGEYGDYDKIYQEFYEFPKDGSGNHYQSGVFMTYEACALGFRRGGRILGNAAQFSSHFIG